MLQIEFHDSLYLEYFDKDFPKKSSSASITEYCTHNWLPWVKSVCCIANLIASSLSLATIITGAILINAPFPDVSSAILPLKGSCVSWYFLP